MTVKTTWLVSRAKNMGGVLRTDRRYNKLENARHMRAWLTERTGHEHYLYRVTVERMSDER